MLGDPGGDDVFLASVGLPFHDGVGEGPMSSANTDGFRPFTFAAELGVEV